MIIIETISVSCRKNIKIFDFDVSKNECLINIKYSLSLKFDLLDPLKVMNIAKGIDNNTFK